MLYRNDREQLVEVLADEQGLVTIKVPAQSIELVINEEEAIDVSAALLGVYKAQKEFFHVACMRLSAEQQGLPELAQLKDEEAEWKAALSRNTANYSIVFDETCELEFIYLTSKETGVSFSIATSVLDCLTLTKALIDVSLQNHLLAQSAIEECKINMEFDVEPEVV